MPLEYSIGDSVEVELAAGGAKVYCDTAELDLSRDDRLYCATVIGEVGKHDLRVALHGNVHGRRHDGRPLTAVVKASWPRPLPPTPPADFAATLDEYDLAQLFSHETKAWEVVMVVTKADANGKLYVATAPGGSVLVDQKSHELDGGVSDAVAVPAELLRAHRDCTENIGKEKSPVRWHRYKADNQRKKEARKAFWESPGEDRKVFDIGPRVSPPAAASSADDAGEARTPRAAPAPAAAAAPAPAPAPAAAPASDEELLASRKRALEAAEATVAGIKSDVKTISTRIVRRRIEDAQLKERAAARMRDAAAAQRAAAEHELAELENLE